MRRRIVSSTMMVSVGFDEDRRLLEIEFVGGDVYHYNDVGHSIYRALMEASSKGQFFHAHIQGIYAHRRVP